MKSLASQTGPIPSDVVEEMLAVAKEPIFSELLPQYAESYSLWSIHYGDLHIDGNFDAYSMCQALFVVGDLIIDGLFEDSEEPESIICVTGNMHAQNVITRGWLEVHGDLTVAGCLVGDYNDCTAAVHGTTRAKFFYPETHYFDIQTLECPCAIGAYHLTNIERPELVFLNDKRQFFTKESAETLRSYLPEKYFLVTDEGLYLFEAGYSPEVLMSELRQGSPVLLR